MMAAWTVEARPFSVQVDSLIEDLQDLGHPSGLEIYRPASEQTTEIRKRYVS
jgi:hypothetical protein